MRKIRKIMSFLDNEKLTPKLSKIIDNRFIKLPKNANLSAIKCINKSQRVSTSKKYNIFR